MSSASDVQPPHRRTPGVLFRLLDPILGFFVWAGHFLAVYIVAAVACALGLAAPNGGSAMLLSVLIGLTGVALAMVVAHATLRARQHRAEKAPPLQTILTVGCDALAGVAIAMKLFPLLLIRVCA